MASLVISWIFLSCLVLSTVPTFAVNPINFVKKYIPKPMLIIENLGSCHQSPELPIQLRDFIVSQTGLNQFVVNGKVSFSRNIDNITIVVEMYKCGFKDYSSCEYYLTVKRGEICAKMKTHKELWNKWRNCTDLPDSCPVPPGIFTVKNSQIDIKDMEAFPLFKSTWKFRITVYQNKELVGCLFFDFTVDMITRSHRH